MTIEEPQQPITVLEIQEFEKEFNLILPENFKKFYLKFNGGFVYDDDDDLIEISKYQVLLNQLQQKITAALD